MTSDDEIEEIKEEPSSLKAVQFWNLCNPPYSNSQKWNQHEEQIIQENAHNFNFKNINLHCLTLLQLLPGRSPGAIYKKLVTTRRLLRIPNTYWSSHQIQALRKGYKEFGPDWKSITFKYLQNKSQDDCKRQYITLQQTDKNKIKEEISVALSSIKNNLEFCIQQANQEELRSLTQQLFTYANSLEQRRLKVKIRNIPQIQSKQIDDVIMNIQSESDLLNIHKTIRSYISDQ